MIEKSRPHIPISIPPRDTMAYSAVSERKLHSELPFDPNIAITEDNWHAMASLYESNVILQMGHPDPQYVSPFIPILAKLFAPKETAQRILSSVYAEKQVAIAGNHISERTEPPLLEFLITELFSAAIAYPTIYPPEATSQEVYTKLFTGMQALEGRANRSRDFILLAQGYMMLQTLFPEQPLASVKADLLPRVQTAIVTEINHEDFIPFAAQGLAAIRLLQPDAYQGLSDNSWKQLRQQLEKSLREVNVTQFSKLAFWMAILAAEHVEISAPGVIKLQYSPLINDYTLRSLPTIKAFT